MRPFALAALCLPLLCAGNALANSMPALPDLPPLPTSYQAPSEDGFYAGVLGGYAGGADRKGGLEAAIVLGHTFMAADLLLGAEVMASAHTEGEGALEANLRLGTSVTDTIDVFGNLGLGYDFERDGFAVLGLSAEAKIADGLLLRVDYRANVDLSGDPTHHRVLTGFVKRF